MIKRSREAANPKNRRQRARETNFGEGSSGLLSPRCGPTLESPVPIERPSEGPSLNRNAREPRYPVRSLPGRTSAVPLGPRRGHRRLFAILSFSTKDSQIRREIYFSSHAFADEQIFLYSFTYHLHISSQSESRISSSRSK